MSDLPKSIRIITAHDSSGQAVVHSSEPLPWDDKVDGGSAAFSLGYITSSIPADFGDEKDIRKYEEYLANPPGIVEKSGSVLRFVDMKPGATSPMHRTVSLDYGVVIYGAVELVLDSGETQLMNSGDVCVQRGTMHAWRNTSETKWARMMYVLTPALPVKIGKQVLSEDLGHIQGVRSST